MREVALTIPPSRNFPTLQIDLPRVCIISMEIHFVLGMEFDKEFKE
jgi:hypothetical protein